MSSSDSATLHVPSVPRALLLPGLDTHEVRDEELPDPTPPGSHVSRELRPRGILICLNGPHTVVVAVLLKIVHLTFCQLFLYMDCPEDCVTF